METGEAILAEMREQTKLLRILVNEAKGKVEQGTLYPSTRTITGPKTYAEMVDAYGILNEAFRQYVNPRAKESITDKAKSKVDARLKRYTIDELTIAMHNFSTDEWNMKNNRHRGLAWFMTGDDRIEEFLNLDLKTTAEAAEKAHACPKCGSKKFGFRATVFQCDSCGYTRVGSQKDADRRGQDLSKGMGLLPGGGRVENGRLVGYESQPRRRLSGSASAGDDASRPGALSPAVSGPGSSGGGDHGPQTPIRFC
jgi:ribosomal protein L37E|tara:strand:- start:3089 stop:3850 length:762 start_codon:yes stop_codon:yes gene_type:complete